MSERNYKTEIIPYALPESNGKVCEVGIEKMSITYVQENDTNMCTEDNPIQTITIETEDAICSREEALNKQGYYLTIKTDRWAIDEPEDLTMLLNDFKDRLYYNVEKLKHKNDTPLNVVQPILRPENPQNLEGLHPMLSLDNPQTFEAVPC